MILILIFAEVLGKEKIPCADDMTYRTKLIHAPLGLYGLIVALLLNSRAKQDVAECI